MIKSKKLSVLLLFLLSLLMIGAVSAASGTSTDDIVNQDINSENNNYKINTDNDHDDVKLVDKANTNTADTKSVNSVNEIKKTRNENNKLSSNKNEEDLLTDTNTPGTFSELQTNITNTPKEGTINLNKDYHYDTGFSKSGIIIENKKITINGNGHTLDAQGQSRIFTLKNAILILDNLKIINGKAEYDGTDYYSGDGGAIFIDTDSTLNITNSQFNNNQAKWAGGAIENYGKLTVINTTFNQNTIILTGSGGAISNAGTLTVINATFNQNQAEWGGAIHIDYGSNLKVMNSLFNKNTAPDGSGDGIFNNAGTCVVEDSVFIDDTIDSNNALGGSTTTCTKFIDDENSFTALNAWINTGNPHVILTEDYTYSNSDDGEDYKNGITITRDVTINGNGHTISGNQEARIFQIPNNVNVVLNNITLTKGQLTLTGTLEDGYGGAIYNKGTLTITNTTITQNEIITTTEADGDGGAIYNKGYLTIKDSNITQNQIGYEDTHRGRGGAIYNDKGIVIIDNSQLKNNEIYSEYGYGGAICMNDGIVTISNSNITGNKITASKEGHGNAIAASNTLTISNTLVSNDNNNIHYYQDLGIFDGIISFLTTHTFSINVLSVFEGEDVVINISGGDSGFEGEVCVNVTNATFNQIVKVDFKNGEGSGTIRLPIGKYNATINIINNNDELDKISKEFMVMGETSFSALYNNITNSQTGQLTLTHNYTYDNRTDTNLKIGIPINKKFTINGNGYTIDGNNTARIFKIDTSDTVIIKNINFINGNATGNNLQNQMGGAIYFTEGSTGTIENCNFTNNTASKYGGAITLYSNGNVTNCNFTNNTALQIGGAIYIINKGNVTNCNFINNKLTSVGNFGGAIWMNDGSVENCNFTNNTALDSGAIYCNKGNITYCTFTNNTASRYGGAIHVGSGTIENCNFVKNTASTGNAIYKDGSSDLIVNHNIFLNNGLSSVIHRDGSATVNLDYNWFGNNATNHDTFDSNIVDGLTLTNWLFLNAMSTPVTVLSTSDINFKLSLYNNSTKTTSEYDNNLLYPVNLTVTYVNGTGEDRVRLGDTVTFKPDTVGTASVTANISNVRYTIKLTINKAEYDTKITDLSFDPLFEGKESLINGTLTANNTGFANQEITINITNDQSHIETYIGKTDNNGKFSIKIKPQVNGEVTITINYPGNQTDKIIYKPTTNTTTQTVTLNKTSYKYLQTQIQDAINNNKNNITLNWDYKYDNDTDYEYIKGITINNKFTIYGNNHTIDGNKEARIFKVTGNGDLTLVNITLTQGKGQNDGPNNWNVGGAIYTNNTNLTLINATLTENTVENEGGAIYTGNNCKINITNTIFSNNQVTKAHGGAIYATGSNTQININNTIFNQNTANKGDGGAIYAFGPKLSIQNSTFKNNKGNWGGAIYAVSGVTKINIKQTLFNNNTATLGGAIHGQYDAQININNTVINNNTAKTGGAISAIGGSKLNINNTVINNNTATGDGGAIYAQEESTKINIKQTLFNNNTATWGGAIYIRNYSELNIKQTLFNNNSAGMGGAIYTTTNTTLNIKQTLFNNNTANYGGSIAASDTSKINMIQTVLSNNTGLAGGAICIQLNCTLKMTKSLFDNNSASIGGAICTYINCTLNMTESLFDNNTALNGTNLCMLNGGSAYIKDTQIDEKDIYNNKTTTDSELARIEILTTLDKFKFNIIDFTQDTTTTISITEPNGFNGTATLIIGDSKEKVEFINGLANIKLNLKPGTYTATITDIEYYNDPTRNLTCTYLTSNNTTQFTVNNKPTPPSPTPSPEPTPTPTGKVATKILAKQKTFKLETKNKKYTITLKDTNGNTIKKAKVTLKIKGKTYKATTNNKGKATFKITKLNKKGKYTAKIQYKGNKKYKATTKKIKLTVKTIFKTIGKNSKNKKMIKKIQKALKKNGYYKHEGKRYLKIDGIYHKWTTKAVKQYQKDKKLQVTGTVNYQTAKKLKII